MAKVEQVKLFSVNLAVASEKCTYMDCDIEEPNGHLFFKPVNVIERQVDTYIPNFDKSKCDGCRKCVDFCHFNALVYIKNNPKVFSEVCHFCGGCELVCTNKAISYRGRPVGVVQEGKYNNINVITGILNTGEASAIPVIKDVLNSDKNSDSVIIDSPPGSACSVMESIVDADYCVLVAEPTSFGFHNFKMVYELVTIMNKKCGVIINKSDDIYAPLVEYCNKENIPVLLEIPYDENIARENAKGNIASEVYDKARNKFKGILSDIRKQVSQWKNC